MKQSFAILIIDDNIDLAENLKDIFEKEGYQAEISADGVQAVEKCAASRFDLALVDVRLPDMSGEDLIAKLDLTCPDTEYIIITGNATIGTAMRAVRQKKILDYQSKPIDIERLLAFIHQVRERREAEEAIRLRSALLDSASDAITLRKINENGSESFVYANTSAARLYGYSPGEFLKLTFYDLLAPERFNTFEGNRKIMLEKGELRIETYHLRRDRSRVPVEVFATLVRFNSGDYILSTIRDITERKKAEAELKTFPIKLIEAQEKERRTIGRELHDQTGQYLTALKLLLTKLARDVPQAAGPLTDAAGLTAEVLQQVKELSLNLRPPMIEELGLVPALAWQFERIETQTGLKVNLKAAGFDKRKIPVDINITAFRIIQEATTNIIRHANVKEADVTVKATRNGLFFTVMDRGRGFNPEVNTVGKSSGLVGMRERAALVGGTLAIKSAPGKGTTVTVELPVQS